MTLVSKAFEFAKNLLNVAASPNYNEGCSGEENDCKCFSLYQKPNVPSVMDLKDQGYKVRITHLRNYIQADYRNLKIVEQLKTTRELREMKEKGDYNCNKLSQWGGATVVELTAPNGEEKIGVAVCSQDDNFNRKYGLSLAIERALA